MLHLLRASDKRYMPGHLTSLDRDPVKIDTEWLDDQRLVHVGFSALLYGKMFHVVGIIVGQRIFVGNEPLLGRSGRFEAVEIQSQPVRIP